MTIWFLMGNHQQLIFFPRRTEETKPLPSQIPVSKKKKANPNQLSFSVWKLLIIWVGINLLKPVSKGMVQSVQSQNIKYFDQQKYSQWGKDWLFISGAQVFRSFGSEIQVTLHAHKCF